MSKKYVWNLSNTYSVFSAAAVKKPISFENQNSQLLNPLSDLQKDDYILGIRNEKEIFVILKVTEKNLDNIKLEKDFENSKTVDAQKYQINISENNIQEIDEELYQKIVKELKGTDTDNCIEMSDNVCKNYMQILYYGVPGCGKSYCIDSKLKELGIENKEYQTKRVVFHPEYTNSDFIGQIIPKVDAAGSVTYEFKAGPFTEILKRAYLNKTKPFALIIEEINRGNAAAIFGELFQLLDRFEENESEIINNIKYDSGWSSYCINNDDINYYIKKDYDENSAFIPNDCFTLNTGMRLPPNLSLFATMNTSDQNVFKLDNAFKRRWDLEMIPNDFDFSCDDEIEQKKQLTQCNAPIDGFDFTWGAFRSAVNELITNPENEEDNSSFSDKQLGTWFVKPNEDGVITAKVFANKVIEYLWDDVFSDNLEILFNKDFKSLAQIIKAIDSDETDKIFNTDFLTLISTETEKLDALQKENYTKTKEEIIPTIIREKTPYLETFEKMLKDVAPDYNLNLSLKHYVGVIKEGEQKGENFTYVKIKKTLNEFRIAFILESTENLEQEIKTKFTQKVTFGINSRNSKVCTISFKLDDNMAELNSKKPELLELMKKAYSFYFKK